MGNKEVQKIMNENVKILYKEVLNKNYNYIGHIIDERKFEQAAKLLGVRYSLWYEAIDCGHYGLAGLKVLK